MSQTLFVSDDLIIKGNAYYCEDNIDKDGVPASRSDHITLDFTVRINAKLKNFTIDLETGEDGSPKNWNEWYRIAEVLEWLGYIKMYWEGPWQSATDLMNEWIRIMQTSIL